VSTISRLENSQKLTKEKLVKAEAELTAETKKVVKLREKVNTLKKQSSALTDKKASEKPLAGVNDKF